MACPPPPPFCTRIVSPVCANGVSFMNRCLAERDGFCKATDGECDTAKQGDIQLAAVSGGVLASLLLCCFLFAWMMKKRSDHLLESVNNSVVREEERRRQARG